MAKPPGVSQFLASERTEPVRFVILLLLFAAAGCATGPSAILVDPPAEPPIPSEALGPEFTEFLLRLLSLDEKFDPAVPPRFLLLLDLDEMPDVARELRRREIIDRRTVDRAEMVLALGYPEEPVHLWVSGRYPRFWTAIALSSRGWRRMRPSVWHDGQGTEINLFRDGLIRLDFRLTEEPHPQNARHAAITGDSGASTHDVLKRLQGESIFVFYVNDPDTRLLFGDIDVGTLQPRDLLVKLDAARNVDLAMRFAGEREARVVLVAMRIAHRRILETLKLEAGPDFSVVRQGVEVRLTGAGATGNSVRTLLDRLPTGEEGQ